MTIAEWFQTHRREAVFGGGGFIIALILVAILFDTPRPTLIDPPLSTKDAVVTLRGSVSPKRPVALFDQAGNALIVVTANEKGEFSFVNVPIREGENVFTLRAIASGWRVSFPRRALIRKDTTVPALFIDALSGATVTESNTVVSGKAEPGSIVTVNGVKTTVNVDGTWSATVALQPGSNSVTVSATDPAGNTATATQSIQYTPTATGSQTGTATVVASSTSVSAGSQPAPVPATTSTPSSGTSPTPPTATPSPTTTPAPAPAPAPQPVLAIVATAWVSNPSPNNRANETISVSVKDNYGRPVTGASVIAAVNYKNGSQNYSLTNQGNGLYTASFKLNDKYVPDERVSVNVTANYNGFTSTAVTSFTPRQ